MFLGILSGFAAAFGQSCSYLCSRVYIRRHGDAVALAVYSQIIMGIMGFATLIVLGDDFRFHTTLEFWGALAGVVATTALGQVFFFLSAAEIEASRLSSLTSLKIVFLAVLCHFTGHESFNALQWASVILCTFAALGMNFSGLKISAKGAVWLLLMIFFYSCCDIFIKKFVSVSEGAIHSSGAAALSYLVLGLVSLPALFFIRVKFRLLKDALAYACAWYGAMMLLYYCFSLLGVVFVNIIVATRGIMSVLLGFGLSVLGYVGIEPSATRSVWVRRFAMSAIMAAAVGIYSYAKTLK